MKKMRKAIPAGHRVLVELVPVEPVQEVKSKGGIIIEIKNPVKLQADQLAVEEAYVCELGINAYKAFDDGRPWCKKGDRILINKFSGKRVNRKVENKTFVVINDVDVLTVFPEEGRKAE